MTVEHDIYFSECLKSQFSIYQSKANFTSKSSKTTASQMLDKLLSTQKDIIIKQNQNSTASVIIDERWEQVKCPLFTILEKKNVRILILLISILTTKL